MGTLVYALYKFGAVACGVGMAVRWMLITTPLTFDVSSRPVFGRLMLEEEPAL